MCSLRTDPCDIQTVDTPGIPTDNPYNERLRQAVDDLLRQDSSPAAQLAATHLLSDLFGDLTGIPINSSNPADSVPVRLPSGFAVSLKAAARCLLDFKRTAQFIRGLEEAIGEMRRRYPDRVIDILYAGCGPYATLALPLCTRYSPEEIRFTLIDIHQRSLDAARAAIERLGFSDFFRAYINGDAAIYQHPSDMPPHIIVAEVLQRSLAREPQVAVTANLAPQLAPGGIFIPQRIIVNFGLMHPDYDLRNASSGNDTESIAPFTHRITTLQPLLDLSAESAPELLRSAVEHSSGNSALPAVTVSIPELNPDIAYLPVFRTNLEIFDGIVLDDYDSGLSYPEILHDLETLHGGETIEFQYILGSAPGFIYQAREGAEPA